VIQVVTAPQYVVSPTHRRHAPPKSRPYVEYRECLRLEFRYTCAYCLTTEREVGPVDEFARFEIEHFKPQGRRKFKHLRCFYPNLLWSCHECNREKGDIWPDASEVAQGYHFIDPGQTALGLHLALSGSRVVSLTNAGEYMIDEIGLNSAIHIYRRERRAQLLTIFATLDVSAQSLRTKLAAAVNHAALLGELDRIEASIAEIRTMLEPTAPPWDAAISCACDGNSNRRSRRQTRNQRKQSRLARTPKAPVGRTQ
jgi:hypothetical protein